MQFTVRVALGAASMLLATSAIAQDAAPPSAEIAPAATAVAPAPVQATPGSAIVAQPLPEVREGSALPSNTDIYLALDRKLDSHKVKVGDTLTFKVARDVMLGNYIVIPRGTPATGRITYRTGRGAFGKSAKIEFDIDSIQLSGHSIPVSGHHRIEGDGNTGATIGAVAAAGVIGGLFVKGKSAVAKEGSEWKVSTKQPVPVSVGS